MRQRTEEEERRLLEWQKLLAEAENVSSNDDSGAEVTVEITVAKVLGIGNWHSKPPEVTVVRDTENRVWILEETANDDADLKGLISRWDVGTGMKFRLQIKKTIHTHVKTKVFPVDVQQALI